VDERPRLNLVEARRRWISRSWAKPEIGREKAQKAQKGFRIQATKSVVM
jgi:hypothetical protein